MKRHEQTESVSVFVYDRVRGITHLVEVDCSLGFNYLQKDLISQLPDQSSSNLTLSQNGKPVMRFGTHLRNATLDLHPSKPLSGGSEKKVRTEGRNGLASTLKQDYEHSAFASLDHSQDLLSSTHNMSKTERGLNLPSINNLDQEQQRQDKTIVHPGSQGSIDACFTQQISLDDAQHRVTDADKAVEELRAELLSEAHTPEQASIFSPEHKVVMQLVCDALRLESEQRDLLLAICSRIPPQRMQTFAFCISQAAVKGKKSNNLAMKLTSRTELEPQEALKVFSTFIQSLDLAEAFQIAVAISPSKMSHSIELSSDQRELVMLLASARHSGFVNFLFRVVKETVEPSMRRICEQLTEALVSQKHILRSELLIRGSSPEHNALLWRSLSTCNLVEMVEADGEENLYSQHLLRNCDSRQVEELFNVLEQDGKNKLERCWLENLHTPVSRKITDLAEERDHEVEVEKVKPRKIQRMERPGSAGRELIDIMQLGAIPVATFQLDEKEETEICYRRFQLVFFNHNPQQKRYILKDVSNIEGEVIMLRCQKRSLKRNQCLFEGSEGIVFFFTLSQQKEYSLNLIRRGTKEVERIQIARDSDLVQVLRDEYYFSDNNRENEATWPSIIRDKAGHRLLVYKHDNEFNRMTCIKFYDLEAERDIAQVDGVSVFLGQFEIEVDGQDQADYCLFEEFGCQIDFQAVRSGEQERLFVDLAKKDLTWKRGSQLVIKQTLNNACYTTRFWKKGAVQGFAVRGATQQNDGQGFVICCVELNAKGQLSVKRLASQKRQKDQFFETFVHAFLEQEDITPEKDKCRFLAPVKLKVSWPESSNWIVVDQPLVFQHDTAFPHCFTVNHLHEDDNDVTEGQGRRNQLSFYLDGSILAFGSLQSCDQRLPSIGVLAVNGEDETASIIVLRHKQSFKRGSVARKECWVIEDQIDISSPQANKFLFEKQQPTISSFFIEERSDILVFIQTEKAIFLITCDKEPEVIFEEDEENILSKVKPFRGPEESPYFYFVVTEVGSQHDQIYQVYKDPSSKKVMKTKVFSVSGGTVQAVEQKRSGELMIIDTDLNMVTARRNFKSLKFKQIDSRGLKRIERLQDFANITSNFRIVMQSRTLVLRDHVFTIGPGKKYKFCHNKTHTVAAFEDILLRDTGSHLFLCSSPGSRKLAIEKNIYQDDIVSAHQVSESLLLLCLKRQEKKRVLRPKHFWSLMTVMGKLLEIPANLSSILHSQPVWSAVLSRMMWDGRVRLVLEQVVTDIDEKSYAIVITLGKNCSLLNFFRLEIPGKPKDQQLTSDYQSSIPDKFSENIDPEDVSENDDIKSGEDESQGIKQLNTAEVKATVLKSATRVVHKKVRRFSNFDQVILPITVNDVDDEQDGAQPLPNLPLLLQKRQSTLRNVRLLKKSMTAKVSNEVEYERRKVLLNKHGDVLLLMVENHSERSCSEPRIQLAEPGQNRPNQIIFKETDSEKLAYAGDFVCWFDQDKDSIKVINLKQSVETKSISLKDLELGDEEENEDMDVVISACSPFILLRQGGLSTLGYESFQRLANHLQVTVKTHNLIFDLNEAKPRLVNELDSADQLADPENFVETGFELTYFDKDDEKTHTVAPSDFGNLVFVSYQGKLQGIYRKYAKIDALEVYSLTQAAKKHLKPKKVDLQSLWASFGNDSLLSLLREELLIFKAIEEEFVSTDFKSVEDEHGDIEQHPDLRRMSYMLAKKNTFRFDLDGKFRISSLLQEELGNMSMRDTMLRVGGLCQDFSLCQYFADQQSFQTVIENISPQVIQALNCCFTETASTRKLMFLQWPNTQSLLTFMSASSATTQAKLQELVMQTEQGKISRLCRRRVRLVMRPVTVRVLDMDWFFHGNQNFLNFSQMLENLPNSVYSCEFMSCLLDQFWSQTQRAIILKQFLPYLAYLVLSILYMYDALNQEAELDLKETSEEVFSVFLGLFVLVLFIYVCRSEFIQFKTSAQRKGFGEYFKNIWNWFDMVGLSMTLLILLLTLFRLQWISIVSMRIMAALASCLNFIKVFDWLRLFEKTAFYVRLIGAILLEIRWYAVLVFMSLLMFGLPLVMLNLNTGKQNQIIKPIFDWWLLDELLDQGLASMGQSDSSNYAKSEQAELVYIFYFLSTFIVKTTMMNMLISIMCDTYCYVIENKHVNSTKTKLQILSEQVNVLAVSNSGEVKEVFMFMVRPSDSLSYDDEDWQGEVNEISRISHQQISALERSLGNKTETLQQTLNEFTRRDHVQDRYLKDLVRNEVANVRKDVQELKDLLQGIIQSQQASQAPE